MLLQEAFRQNLIRFRHQNGFTQKELAEISGISLKYIYKLEKKDGSNPTLFIIDLLSKTLGVSPISFFLDENGNKIEFE